MVFFGVVGTSYAYCCLTHPALSSSQTNPAGRALFEVMVAKQTNLCVAADVTTSAELLTLAAAVGKNICCLKTHCDIVSDWTAETAVALQKLAQEHNFCIFEDRKFADIGNTVVHQCRDGWVAAHTSSRHIYILER